MQPGVKFVCALGLAALAIATLTKAAPAKPDCTTASEYFDKGPDNRKYVHCRKGEVLFKECSKGKVWNQARSSCEAKQGVQQAEESDEAAELSIMPGDWRSLHGWCWGWPILHVTPVVVYRYKWVTGFHSGWYGRHYSALPLSEGTQNEANDETNDNENAADSGETADGEHQAEQSGEQQKEAQHNQKEEHHELVEEH